MGIEELERIISTHNVLALDTMVFAYHLANHPRYSPLTRVVLNAVEFGRVAGVTTTVTLAEILTLPAQAGDREAMLDYELYLTTFPNLNVMPLDASLARETAWVRAATGLRTPDAVQIAAARLAHADAIVGNDRRWRGRIDAPDLILLDDYAGGS